LMLLDISYIDLVISVALMNKQRTIVSSDRTSRWEKTDEQAT
jgi:hypothetical protein